MGGLSWIFIVGPIEPIDWTRRKGTLTVPEPVYVE
jgi:hypothetical protein